MDKKTQKEKHEEAKRKRRQHVETILAADSRRKIVVGGPGTGKTYLFKRMLDGKKNTLTLTFVNTLVEDLSLDLFGLSEVRTLHGFARQQLAKAAHDKILVFPKLSAVIKQDAMVLLGKEINFDSLFHNKCDSDDSIEFYRKRRVYYGHYGYSDLIYAAVRLFEKHPDRIPAYSQVVVDEFQDFNAIEVSLIDLLASKSPVLLAGDDDQALYETLKSASPGHIRQRHADRACGYQSFTLPYCSRCTRVLVDAANDLIGSARKAGFLSARIDKPFVYFDDPLKDIDSECNPRIIYAQVYAAQIPWFIHERVKDIATELRGKFSALLISPTRVQCRQIVGALRDKGFENVHYDERTESAEPELLDGLKLLLEDRASNLGWRIVAKALLPANEFESILRKTADIGSTPSCCDLIERPAKKEALSLLMTLRAVKGGADVRPPARMADLLKRVDVDPMGIATAQLREQICSPANVLTEPGLKKIFIKATTIPSAKGLTADYVFITHFDDRYFIKNRDKGKITDQDISNFVVALTRASKKVFLVSSDTRRKPTFLNWIDNARICTME